MPNRKEIIAGMPSPEAQRGIAASIEAPEDHRTGPQRCADAVCEFCGSWSFVTWFSVLIVVWVAINTWWILFGAFDPYPYIALNLVLTIVSTMQGPLIMMSQNRQADRDREAEQRQADRDRETWRRIDAKLDALAHPKPPVLGYNFERLPDA